MQGTDQIYQQYAQRVYKFLMSLTGDEDIAEEVLQETFYQAIKNIHKFDGTCKITTWLCAIAKNQLLIYRRKHPITEEYDVEHHSDLQQAPSTEDQVIQTAQKADLLKRIHAFDEPFREILYLRIFGELSFREIGEIFGKTENWARVIFYRSKEKLRKGIEKDEE